MADVITALHTPDCGEQEAAQNPHHLILINPAGGKGLAVSQFQKVVQPMLDIAEITYETIVTGECV